MRVAFDNTFLSLVLNPNSKPFSNPQTGKPIEYCKERIEALIDKHSDSRDTILIPTPCLAELLTAVPDVSKAISEINNSATFEVAPFDARCAIELGLETHNAIAAGDKKSGASAGWQQVKFDRQIAIIAKVGGVKIFYTDDENQTIFAEKLGMTVKHTWDLPFPPARAQTDIFSNGGS